jgi:hypothetical protein
MSLLLLLQIAKVAAAAQAGVSHRELKQLLSEGYPISFLWQQIMREMSSLYVRRPVSGPVIFVPLLLVGIEQQPVRYDSHSKEHDRAIKMPAAAMR